MEPFLLWRCIYHAVERTTETAAASKLDAATERALGEDIPTTKRDKGLDPWNDILKLTASEDSAHIDAPFLNNRTLQHQLYEFLVIARGQQQSLAYRARLVGLKPNDVPAPWIALPGLAPLLRFVDEWAYAQALGIARCRVCALPMWREDIGYVERSRLARAISERAAEQSQFVKTPIYVPFDFDRVPANIEKERKRAQDQGRRKTRAASKSRGDKTVPRESRALAIFFDVDMDVKRKTSSEKQQKVKQPYWKEFFDQLELEGRKVDAEALRSYQQGAARSEIQEILHNIKDPAKESAYARWVARATQPTVVYRLYREWALRRADYVLHADKQNIDPTLLDAAENRYTKVAAGDSPCAHGGILAVIEQMAQALDQPKRALAIYTGFAAAAAATTTTTTPPAVTLQQLLEECELLLHRALADPIRAADQWYARDIGAGMWLDGGQRPLSEWMIYDVLPRLRQQFIEAYYRCVEIDPRKEHSKSMRTPAQVTKPLRTLERLYHLKVLHAWASELSARLGSFRVPAHKAAVDGVAEMIQKSEVIRALRGWYDDATKGTKDPLATEETFGAWTTKKPAAFLGEGAMALGTTALLLANLLEHACRAPFINDLERVLGIESPPASEQFDVAKPISPAEQDLVVTVARVVKHILEPAVHALDAQITEQSQALEAGTSKTSETDDNRVRLAVLSVRNYLLGSQLADRTLRRALIDSIDTLWAEHLGDWADVAIKSVGAFVNTPEIMRWLETLQPDELAQRSPASTWFRRPSNEEYQSGEQSRTVRQQALGTDADWQSEPARRAVELQRYVETQLAANDAEVERWMAKNTEHIQAFIAELRRSHNPDIDRLTDEEIVAEIMDTDIVIPSSLPSSDYYQEA